MKQTTKTVSTSLGLQSLWGAVERLSLTLIFVMLTTATAWADNVMYVIATELSDNITITQRNEDGNTSNFSVKKVKLTFYYGERPTGYTEGSEVWNQRTESFGGSCIFDVPTAVPISNDDHYPEWYVNSSKNAARRHQAVTQISFDASFAAARPESTAYWFYNMENLTSKGIDFTNLNTSSTVNMKRMFSGCQSIKNLDLSGWNVANVTDMSYMFSDCSILNTIKLVGWKVTRLQYASGMFADCEKLTYIYCDGNWDKNSLTQSSFMFKNCTSLPGYKSSSVKKNKAKPQPDGYFTPTGLTWNASDGYYEINDEQDLIDLANYVIADNTCAGLTFKMTRDLDFTNMPKDLKDGIGNFLPIGFGQHPFYGHFDGQNHSITGLYFNGDSPYVGLFCVITNSGIAVERVTLVNPNITAARPAGGIVAGINAGTISNCAIVGGSITADYQVGGIVGEAKNTTVSGCSVLGTSFTAGNPVGIIAGLNKGGLTISNCNYYNIVNGLSICGSGSYTDGGGNQQVYQVNLGEGITATSPAFAYDNKAYYAENATVTLGTNRTGYVASGYQSNDVTISNGSFTMPASDVSINANWADPSDISVNAAVDEYTIKTTAGWGVFCDILTNNAKGYFTSKTVKLTPSSGNSISVTRMAGSSQHDFTGTFDGDGNTLTVSYGTEGNPISEEYAAPFRFVDGATIQNLRVSGTIISTVRRASGVIGETGDNTSHITNCVSSSTISGGNFTGGFSIGGNVEIDGCVYNGKINGSGNSGGFVGYSQPTLKITNSLFAPQSGSSIGGGTFYYNGGGNITPVNSYYTQALGTAQGKFAHGVDAAPANLGEAVTDESITVLTAYENGILFDKKYYVAPQAVTLADNAANDLSGINGYLADVTLQGRTLYKDGDWNTLVLPFDVEIKESVLDGADVRALADANLSGEVLTLNFTKEGEVSTIEAGKPYIIKWKEGENLVSPVFKGVTVSSTTDNFESTDHKVYFKGTYAPLSWNAENQSILFLGTGNKLNWPLAGARLNAFRAYFELMGEACAREFVMNFEGETTGVVSMYNEQCTMNNRADAWYTVNGVKLDGKPTAKGIYVKNGKKVVVK